MPLDWSFVAEIYTELAPKSASWKNVVLIPNNVRCGEQKRTMIISPLCGEFTQAGTTPQAV
jgi:hypothetical protein